MTPEEAQTRAILSLLDVVEEIAWKVGEADWARIVSETFQTARQELRWPEMHSVDDGPIDFGPFVQDLIDQIPD